MTLALLAAAADSPLRHFSLLAERDEVMLVTLGFLLLAAAVLRGAPAHRGRVRSAFGLFAFSLLLLGSAAASAWGGFPRVSMGLENAGLIVGGIAIVNLISLFFFDVALPVVRLHSPRILRDLVVALGYLGIFIWMMSRGGVSLSGIVTTSAVITAVIGFSLQDTLGNVMGGLALQMEKSINTGDWIQVGATQGQVKDIGWRHTAIETRNWDTLIIPNSVLMKGEVTVLGRRTHLPLQHRMWVYFSVDYRVPPTDVIQAVETALRAEPIPGVAADPPPNCITWEYKESYMNYAVRYWLTDLLRDDPTNSAVRVRIYFALKRAGIPLSIPAHTLFVNEESTERLGRHQEKEIQRRVSALRHVELFHTMTEEELRMLADRTLYAPFTCGEAMTRQGAEAHWLYIITKGAGDVLIADSEGVRRHVASLQSGDFFGEMGMMTGSVRSATVLATEDTECFRLDKDAFRDILNRRPEIAEHISHVLARRRVELEAVRDNLDAQARSRRLAPAQQDILSRITKLFGLRGGAARAGN
ncbi:MAG TPA: cyclic nucleotide-binding domain-containing protein [Terriglobales bacterium]|nr:cyclic nucleotide-binding domain-containing protein [Terriglobales bacterium]